MGIDITYKAGESELSFRLPPSEIQILELLRKKGFEKEVEVIFGVSGFGESTEIDKMALSQAVNSLLQTIKNDRCVLPYVYSTKTEISRGSGMYSGGGGIISGFKIGGIPHSIEAGLNTCILTKLVQDQSGKWKDTEPKDVRNQKIIKVDEDNFFGDIEIKKKRKPTKLIKNLKQLLSFLNETDDKVVQKILG